MRGRGREWRIRWLVRMRAAAAWLADARTDGSPTPAPATGALGSDGARKTTIHYLGAATLLFLAS